MLTNEFGISDSRRLLRDRAPGALNMPTTGTHENENPSPSSGRAVRRAVSVVHPRNSVEKKKGQTLAEMEAMEVYPEQDVLGQLISPPLRQPRRMMSLGALLQAVCTACRFLG